MAPDAAAEVRRGAREFPRRTGAGRNARIGAAGHSRSAESAQRRLPSAAALRDVDGESGRPVAMVRVAGAVLWRAHRPLRAARESGAVAAAWAGARDLHRVRA